MRTLALLAIAVGLLSVGLSGPIDRWDEARVAAEQVAYWNAHNEARRTAIARAARLDVALRAQRGPEQRPSWTRATLEDQP